MGAALAPMLLELVREAPAEVRREIPDDVTLELAAIELDELHADGLELERRLDVLERRYPTRR
jgi:hypothetical protein